jgi:transcriptional regulator
MYDISYFKATDHAEVIAFMNAHPFVLLCGVNKEGYPVATHVPVLLEVRNDKLFLLGHFMRNQEHTLSFEQHNKCLAVFSGAHSYISASWYTEKNVASTWNYQAVHAKGHIHWMDDHSLYLLLDKLTTHFEGNENSAASFKKMDESYIQKNMKAIVGFEMEISALEHVYKLSQNRDKESYSNITTELKKGNEDEQYIASIMEKRKDQLFEK